MNEEASRILEFLPISFRNPSEQEYITFLWDAFETNYDAGKYPFAFLAYHMLFMCFVYFEIWQIKSNHETDFEKAMVGFNKDMENELMKASTPFMLWRVNESSVFRFLKLIGMSNSEIGECAKIVSERNDTAHSNGNIYFRDQRSLDEKIEGVLRCVEAIQRHSEKVIKSCYEDFLSGSADLEQRDYIEDEDQIREMLVYGNYLSQKDIEYLQKYDCKDLVGEDQNLVRLTEKLCEMYPIE